MAEQHEYIDFGNNVTDVFDAAMKQGTIVSVDGDTKTAVVNIDDHGEEADVPIFYHCEGQQVVDNGWSAFNAGDRVLVLAYRHRASVGVKTFEVVGFVKDVKPCRIRVAIFGALAIYTDPGGNWVETAYAQMWNLKDDVPITKWRTKTFPERIFTYEFTMSGDTLFRFEYNNIQYSYDPRFPQNNAYDRGLRILLGHTDFPDHPGTYRSTTNIEGKSQADYVPMNPAPMDYAYLAFSWGYSPMSGVYAVQQMDGSMTNPAIGGTSNIIAGSRIFGEPQAVNMDPDDDNDEPPYKVDYSPDMSQMLVDLIALATPYRAYPPDPNAPRQAQLMAPILGSVDLIDIQTEEPEE